MTPIGETIFKENTSANGTFSQASPNHHQQLRHAVSSKGKNSNLSVYIPPNTSMNNSAEPRRVGAFLLPASSAKAQNQDDDSDASSICHSPSWENAETKKERKVKQDAKDQRKKEKERAEKEARKERPKKRLVKAPPASKHNKMMILADTSKSAPPLPSNTRISNDQMRTLPWRAQAAGESLDATNDAPAPRSSTQSTFEVFNSSRASDGFIGGVKLKQADAGTVLQSIRRQTSVEEKIVDDPTAGEMTSQNRIRKPITHTHRERHQQPVSIDFSSSLDSLTNHHANPVTIPVEDSDRRSQSSHTSIMDRPIKRGHQTKQSIGEYIFPDATKSDNYSGTEDSRYGESSSTAISTPVETPGTREAAKKATKPPRKAAGSPVRPPISYREPASLIPDTRGRPHLESYVGGYRKQSQTRSMAGYEDEVKVSSATEPTKGHSRGRSWSIRSFTRKGRKSAESSRAPSLERDEVPIASEKMEEMQASDDYHSFLAGMHPALSPTEPQPRDRQSTELPQPNRAQFRHSALSPTTASFINFKNAAKSTFRHSFMPRSPTSELVSPTTKQPVSAVKKRSSVLSMKISDKANRVLGETVLSPSLKQPEPSLSPIAPVLPAMEFDAPNLHSRSTTSSSVQTFNNSTTHTTPIASRPPSGKDTPVELSPTGDAIGFKSHPLEKGNATKPEGALFFNDTSRVYETWSTASKSTLILDAQDKDREATPKPKKAIPNFSYQKPSTSQPREELQPEATSSVKVPVPAAAITSTDIQRVPSISKSISTPNLQEVRETQPNTQQDLSFLPKLKHQPFSKPSDERRKSQQKLPVSILKPSSASSISTTSSNNKNRFPALNAPNPTPDPIAKMLVVCCSCRYFHDLPSKLYECMARPDNVVEDKSLGVSGVITTVVKCPWCGHGMSTGCCEGYAAVVYLRERLH